MRIRTGHTLLAACLVVAWGCDEDGGGADCGDGEREGDEVCDGDDLGDETCETQGLMGGTLACNDTCDGFVTSDCTDYLCGDGEIDGAEVCDGTNLDDATCETEGFSGGDIACADDCLALDLTGCTGGCGNAVIEGDEVCDDTALDGETCEGLGFDGGDLACSGDCLSFDTAGCTSDADCGDGTIEGPEVCDGTNLGTPARTCADEGFDGGDLACAGDCLSFDTTGCTSEPGGCGDGTVEFPEECDGSVPAGTDCTSRGFTDGTVTCNADCTLDVSGCTATWCGDGTIDGSEDCDGTDLGSPARTCADEGFSGGDIACADDCTWDLTGCTGGCGNGVIDGAETCDGADLGTPARTCVDEGFVTGALACNATCDGWDTSACAGDSVCTVDGAALGDLHLGEIISATGDTTGATDDEVVSCQSSSATATSDVAFEVVVQERGQLVVGTDNYWHVVALFADAASAGACMTDEMYCHDPYFYGNPARLGVVDPGRYYIVVSDWDESLSLAFSLTVSLVAEGEEICNSEMDEDGDGDAGCADTDCTASPFCIPEADCSNSVDDDYDALVDCVDPDCVGSGDCTGSSCVADEDLGSLAAGEGAVTSVDVTSATNDLSLSCTPSDGNDHVIRFALTEEAPVHVTVDQSTGSAHAVGFFLQAGAGSACTDAELFCSDISASTADPEMAGLVSADPLPAGTYYLILESTAAGAGTVDVTVVATGTTEGDCGDGLDNDGDGTIDCADTECVGSGDCTGSSCVADHDFGTLSPGDSVTHTGDTSTTSSVTNLSCATADGNDWVWSFTLSEPAMVYTEIDQASGTGHATSLTLQAGTGTGCAEAEFLCLDLSGGDYSPDASGFLSYPDPLPAGTYYFVAEAVGTAGAVDILFDVYETSETSCDDTVDNDGDGATDCADSDCDAETYCAEDCDDTVDNDGDGDVDCADSECAEEPSCIEDCTDGTDNDADGATDCADLDCEDEPTCADLDQGPWEWFPGDGTDDFDLVMSMATFTPAAGYPGGYVWVVADSIPDFPVAPGSSASPRSLTLDDDGAAAVTLSSSCSGVATLFGETHDTVNVGSNGMLTFGAGNENTSYSPSLPGLFAVPTIAPLWIDLDPTSGGTVTFDEFSDRFAVTWSMVPEFGGTDPNSFQIVVWCDGHVDVAWLGVMAVWGLTGLSNGGASVVYPDEVDFD